MQRCTICNGHHRLESSDLCPVCEGSQVGSRTNTDKRLSLDLSDMCNMLKSAVYADGHADGAFRVTHDRLVSASEELLRRAKEAPGADVEAYIQCSAILLHLSKQVRADDPAIVP